jgi:3-oxoacyl-[acyl-carrier-protein] synthase II
MNKAFVVGYGLVDALGTTPKECFANIINEKDFNKQLPALTNNGFKINRGIPVENNTIMQCVPGFDEKMWKYTTKTQKMGLHSVDYAIKKSKLPLVTNVLVIQSSLANETECLEQYFESVKNLKRMSPRVLINRTTDTACAHVTNLYKFMGPSFAIHAASATGIASIEIASKFIEEYDYIVVGSGDAGCHRMAVNTFATLGAIGNYSMPFDDKRHGFVMGEGYGTLILQSEQMVKKYQSKVYATLYPAGIASDAFDYTKPASDGRGALLSLKSSLKYVDSIDVINSHATSTQIGDLLEYNILTSNLKNVPIYAPKSKTGHTLAGAGIIECVYAIESMRQGIIPHIHNLNTCSFDTDKVLVREPTKIDKKTIRTLNTSFGFGGKCASQVIEVTRE